MTTTKKLVLQAVERTATTYRFRAEGDGGFGWAICTVNDATGELVIVSDYGNWAYRWNTSPSALGFPTLTAFLAERGGVDYLARKLQGSRGGERFSVTKTALAIGRLIALRRLEDGREQLERRWDDEFPIPAHVRGYDEQGLPTHSHRIPAGYRSGRPWDEHGRPYEGLPYLTRDAARELWDKVDAVAYDVGDSADLFIERLPRELYEIVEEPWNELQHEQTPEDRALRDLCCLR
jgi:hypothetical protein